MRELGLSQLRQANAARETAAGDWGLDAWLLACQHSLGKAVTQAHLARRGQDLNVNDFATALADLMIYVDLLAAYMQLDLVDYVAHRFNEASDARKSDVRLRPSAEDKEKLVATIGTPKEEGEFADGTSPP